jgi:hypothetical protein
MNYDRHSLPGASQRNPRHSPTFSVRITRARGSQAQHAASPRAPRDVPRRRYRLLFKAMVEAAVRKGGERWGARFGLHTAGVGTAAVVRWYDRMPAWWGASHHNPDAVPQTLPVRPNPTCCRPAGWAAAELWHRPRRPSSNMDPSFESTSARQTRTGSSGLPSTSLQLRTAWALVFRDLHVWRGSRY